MSELHTRKRRSPEQVDLAGREVKDIVGRLTLADGLFADASQSSNESVLCELLDSKTKLGIVDPTLVAKVKAKLPEMQWSRDNALISLYRAGETDLEMGSDPSNQLNILEIDAKRTKDSRAILVKIEEVITQQQEQNPFLYTRGCAMIARFNPDRAEHLLHTHLERLAQSAPQEVVKVLEYYVSLFMEDPKQRQVFKNILDSLERTGKFDISEDTIRYLAYIYMILGETNKALSFARQMGTPECDSARRNILGYIAVKAAHVGDENQVLRAFADPTMSATIPEEFSFWSEAYKELAVSAAIQGLPTRTQRSLDKIRAPLHTAVAHAEVAQKIWEHHGTRDPLEAKAKVLEYLALAIADIDRISTIEQKLSACMALVEAVAKLNIADRELGQCSIAKLIKKAEKLVQDHHHTAHDSSFSTFVDQMKIKVATIVVDDAQTRIVQLPRSTLNTVLNRQVQQDRMLVNRYARPAELPT